MQKYIPLIMYCGNSLLCLYVNYIVTNRSLHVRSSDPICVQNCRPLPLTVFEILGFKLKKNGNDDDKKNWRNGPFIISPMSIQFKPNTC